MTDQIKTVNKEIIQRLYKEVLVEWNMEVVDELVSNQFTSHDWPADAASGPESFKHYYTGIIKSVVPDARYKVDDLIGEGDKVVVRWRLLGTHEGCYLNIAPTGRAITLRGIAIYRLENGKLAERWVVTDLYSLLQELQVA